MLVWLSIAVIVLCVVNIVYTMRVEVLARRALLLATWPEKMSDVQSRGKHLVARLRAAAEAEGDEDLAREADRGEKALHEFERQGGNLYADLATSAVPRFNELHLEAVLRSIADDVDRMHVLMIGLYKAKES